MKAKSPRKPKLNQGKKVALLKTTKSRIQHSLKVKKPEATKYISKNTGTKVQKSYNQKTNRIKGKKRMETNHKKVSL